MTTDLTRARRKLAALKLRLIISKYGDNITWPPNADELRRAARRMARELEAQIAAQSLECRRLALTGPWEAVTVDGTWTARRRLAAMCDLARRYTGPRAQARAVAYAEKMNRKAGGK